MVKSTREKILDYIKFNKKARAEDIRREFGLGRAIIHRHLKKLTEEKKVSKFGKPPLVYYIYTQSKKDQVKQDFTQIQGLFLTKNYLYVSPSGKLIYGPLGFKTWVKNTKQEKYLVPLVEEYIKYRKNANMRKEPNNLISGTDKIRKTFEKVNLKQVFFADFYSLPKFGKTILGQKILYAKQAQSETLIREISQEVKPLIENLIKQYEIDSIGFIPPTIPRKVQFLKELEKDLDLSLPKITLTKAYPGDIPVAQKTLSKLEERINNAKNTIFAKNQSFNSKKILLIDDALGSGSTLNEVAAKIKDISPKINVYGFAVVGSFKGFDVISEV